jgi:hypothetical protein
VRDQALDAQPLAHARGIALAAFGQWPVEVALARRPPVGLGVPHDEEPPPLRWLVHGIVAGPRAGPDPHAWYHIPDHTYVKFRIPFQGLCPSETGIVFSPSPSRPSGRGQGEGLRAVHAYRGLNKSPP